jgi:phosphatidylglycerophosphate synthase
LLIFLTPIDQYKNVALIIIFSKNILDNVDGYIARKRKLISRFGDKLDLLSGKIFYHTILLCFIFHIFHFNKEIVIFGFYFLIFFLDYFNSNKSKHYKKKLFFEKIKITKKNLLIKLLLILNYNGQTMITDIIVLIISLEIFFQKLIISHYLICIFVLLKILRNTFSYLKR